jgi:hypothetical protein
LLVNLKVEKGWWQPHILKRREKGNLTLKFIDSDGLESKTHFSKIKTVENSLRDINYIVANWSSEDINRMT